MSCIVYLFVNCKFCVFIYFRYYNIPGIEPFKKEMFKAGGFEPRILQLLVRNFTASAKSFQI